MHCTSGTLHGRVLQKALKSRVAPNQIISVSTSLLTLENCQYDLCVRNYTGPLN